MVGRVVLNGMDFFELHPKKVIDHLEELSGPPAVAFELCYFRGIGISLAKWIDVKTLSIRPSRREKIRISEVPQFRQKAHILNSLLVQEL